ncbi:MAG TPA: hypothetical protein IAC21_01940 [Candidatus Enterenecus merdae]|nr:hypothetical protein [Candidatus Enterenecus merdae]
MSPNAIRVLLSVNNILLILFYHSVAISLWGEFWSGLWGLSWLVFLVLTSLPLIDVLALKKSTPRLALQTLAYLLVSIVVIGLTLCAMAMGMDFLWRVLIGMAVAGFSALHLWCLSLLNRAEDKYIVTNHRLTEKDWQQYLRKRLTRQPYSAPTAERTEISVLNLCVAILSILILFFTVPLKMESLPVAFQYVLWAILAVSILLFYILNVRTYQKTGRNRRMYFDFLCSAIAFAVIWWVRKETGTNFIAILLSFVFLCPFWLSCHEVLCRFQLGWELR